MWRIFRRDAVEVLHDERARASLARYFAVMSDEKPAKFMIAKRLPAEFDEESPLEELWLKHEKLTEEFYRLQDALDSGRKSLDDLDLPEKSYLDLKIAIANKILEKCHFCNRRCGVNRLKGELGYCKCGTKITVSSIFEHIGEEPELVPSGTIFTMGCTIRCLHCQNWTICVTGDSLVLLSNGTLIEISRLFDESVSGELKEIHGSLCVPANLSVFSVDESAKVVVDFCRGVSKRLSSDLIEITTQTGRKIAVTPNHLLYTCYNGLIIPVPAKELKEGDFIATIRFIPDIKGFPTINIGNPVPRVFCKITPPTAISPELCRIIGYLLSDGHIYVNERRGIYKIVFTNTDQDLLEDYVNCFKIVFGLTPKVLKYSGIFRAIVQSVDVFNFLREVTPQLLAHSNLREVPSIIMQADNNMVASFLKGIFDSEATVNPRSREITLYSTSEKLLVQIQILLCRYGIISQIHLISRKRKKRIERTYKLSITGEDVSRYNLFIGFTSSKKIRKLEKIGVLRASPREHINIIPNISDLLRDLRARLRLTQRDVRSFIKGYGHLECKNRPFPRSKLEEIALFFEKRLRSIEELNQRLVKLDWNTIKYCMKALNISQREIASILNVSRSLVKYYMHKESLSAKKFLDKLSTAIKCILSEILSDKMLLENLSRLKVLVNADIFWDKIVKVLRLNEKTWVYDIMVQNTNRFIVNGFLVHNSQWFESGEIYTPGRLASAVENLRRVGCRNANLVGGEPTPWLEQWLETFKLVNINIPVVWNSNSYYSEETAKLLAGFVDVYLLDFKYGPFECSRRISDAPNYWDVCTRNHLYGKRYGELIIRVLVLPGHLECCTKHILKWIADNLGRNTRTNVMFQYRPEWRAYEVPELRRRLTAKEMERAIEISKEAGLTNFIT